MIQLGLLTSSIAQHGAFISRAKRKSQMMTMMMISHTNQLPQDPRVERAMGALLGVLVGDGLGFGMQWYYDREQKVGIIYQPNGCASNICA